MAEHVSREWQGGGGGCSSVHVPGKGCATQQRKLHVSSPKHRDLARLAQKLSSMALVGPLNGF